MRKLSLSIACLLYAANVFAQAFPVLVSDIFPGKLSSLPRNFYELNGDLIFQARSSATADGLLVSDGTTPGTRVLMNSLGKMKSQTTLNGNVYFINEDDDLLWVTDGVSAAGTHSINNNIEMHHSIFAYQNKLLFGGNSAGGYTSLWMSDGTTAGTFKLKDISTGNNADINCFTEIDGKVCFYVENAGDGSIWITDGTAAGTYKLKDIWVSNPSPYNDYSIADGFDAFKLFNGKLYFAGNDNVHGFELWETDGTEAGTKMTADINPGTTSSEPYDFTVYKGKLVFHAYNPAGVDLDRFDIWTLHGEANTLTKVTNAPKCFYFRLYPFNDKLYTSNCGYLYETDGTTAGSRRLNNSIIIHYTIEHKGYLYFEGADLADPLQVQHLYRMGTDNVITPLFSLNRNDAANSKNEYRIRSVGGELYFDAADPAGALNEDIELYRLGEFPAGVTTIEKATGNLLYPNPANTTFNVRGTTGNATVNVYTLTGQLLLTTQQTEGISIVHLPAGTYMVQLMGSDGKVTMQKLVKE